MGGENFSGDFRESGHVVRRVGEDDVEGGAGGGNVAEYVATDEAGVWVTEFFYYGAYEIVLYGSLFYGGDGGAAAGEKFKCDSSCPGEKIKCGGSFKVDEVFDNVEDVLTGKVGGGTCGDVSGYVEASTSVFSSDYSHELTDERNRVRSKGRRVTSVPSGRMRGGRGAGERDGT